MASPSYQHADYPDLDVQEPGLKSILEPISLVRTARWDDEYEMPRQLSAAELHALYAGTTVPQHRYLAAALHEAVHSWSIALDPARWFTGIAGIHLPSLANDWLTTTG